MFAPAASRLGRLRRQLLSSDARQNLQNAKCSMLIEENPSMVHAHRLLIIHACLRHAHGPLRGQIIKI
jgi:hypothetical protein